MMNTESSQGNSNPQNGHCEEMIQMCKQLSFGEKNQIRHNITGIKDAIHYDFEENRSVRMSVIPPPLPVDEEQNDGRPKPVPLAHIINCFNSGSLSDYGRALQGLFSVSFNIYKVTFRTESIAKQMVEKFTNESTGKGITPEEIFTFSVADFKDPIKTITFFPIPVEIAEVQMKDLVENTLNIGQVENISWGRHRETSWRNGFVHVRVRTKRDDIPDRVYINTRSVTILKENQRLFRPCPLCNMRNHEIKFCPSFFHFENFVVEKNRKNQEFNDAELARKAHAEEQLKLITADLRSDHVNDDLFMSENPSSATVSGDSDEDTIKIPMNLSTSTKLTSANPLDGSQNLDEEEVDEELTADMEGLIDTHNKTIHVDSHSQDETFPPTSALPIIAGVDVEKRTAEIGKIAQEAKKVKQDKSRSEKVSKIKQKNDKKENPKKKVDLQRSASEKRKQTSPLQKGISALKKMGKHDNRPFLGESHASSSSKNDGKPG